VPFLSQFRAAPNLLTLLRLFIIPFLVIEILDGEFRVAFALFLLAGLSDALYLDPIADKLLLSTLFLVLTHVGLIPRYVTVLVFSRDLGILLIATLLFATNTLRDFRPSLFGKLNTLVQIIALVMVLAERALPIAHLPMLRDGLIRAIAILAPLSAAQYAWIVIARISAHETPAARGAPTTEKLPDPAVPTKLSN
jgi:cardiolipin synthase